ncbi:hypothetical protein DI43_15215 [Geobacillus sp. CAMR12739]|nr:hypothetical protein DI43_15215 [Geobacillus sp. CAMR12739]
MGINNQGFEYGVFPYFHGALPTGDFEYGLYVDILNKSNQPPPNVTLISPITGLRVSPTPVFIMECDPDPEGAPLHFIIEVATTNTFTPVLNTFNSQTDQTGWQYSTNGGATWLNIPAAGVQASSRFRVKFTSQVSIPIGTYYYRVFAFDGSDRSVSYTPTTLKVGNAIIVTLKNPIQTTAAVRNIVPVVMRTLPTDGATPASIKFYVTNNAFDASPTWEDATAAVINKGQAYTFTNNTKTGANWGLNIRIELYANDSLGAISLDGFGFTFN